MLALESSSKFGELQGHLSPGSRYPTAVDGKGHEPRLTIPASNSIVQPALVFKIPSHTTFSPEVITNIYEAMALHQALPRNLTYFFVH